MASSIDLKGAKPVIEHRASVDRFFITFPRLRVELAMAPTSLEVAHYLAYHSSIGSPFHTRIPTFPLNTAWPRPNIVYPPEVEIDIGFSEVSGKEVAIPQQKEEAIMATTVTVKARAWGAIVTLTKKVEGEEGHNVDSQIFELPGNTTKDFVICEHERLEVEMGAAPAAGGQDGPLVEKHPDAPLDPNDVPGRAENDALVKNVPDDFAKFDHDGDGHPGGSKKKAKSADDAS